MEPSGRVQSILRRWENPAGGPQESTSTGSPRPSLDCAPALVNPQVVSARYVNVQFDPQEVRQLFDCGTGFQLDLNSRIFVATRPSGIVESKNAICCEELPCKMSHQMRIHANRCWYGKILLPSVRKSEDFVFE